MNNKPYYLAYEERYQKVYEAGARNWGHSAEDEILVKTLSQWVEKNDLYGKGIIEFACGEGASGVILSELGCIYYGVDIAPSAVDKAADLLRKYPNSRVAQLDMVNQAVHESFDGAIDVMGLHMLVTDSDRKKYLENAYRALKAGAPMLFFRESFRSDMEEIRIESFEQWKAVTCCDYQTPEPRVVNDGDKEVEVWIPCVPARAKSKSGYMCEMEAIGFVVDDFIEMDINNQCVYSASIFVHKPWQ